MTFEHLDPVECPGCGKVGTIAVNPHQQDFACIACLERWPVDSDVGREILKGSSEPFVAHRLGKLSRFAAFAFELSVGLAKASGTFAAHMIAAHRRYRDG